MMDWNKGTAPEYKRLLLRIPDDPWMYVVGRRAHGTDDLVYMRHQYTNESGEEVWGYATAPAGTEWSVIE